MDDKGIGWANPDALVESLRRQAEKQIEQGLIAIVFHALARRELTHLEDVQRQIQEELTKLAKTQAERTRAIEAGEVALAKLQQQARDMRLSLPQREALVKQMQPHLGEIATHKGELQRVIFHAVSAQQRLDALAPVLARLREVEPPAEDALPGLREWLERPTWRESSPGQTPDTAPVIPHDKTDNIGQFVHLYKLNHLEPVIPPAKIADILA